MTSSSRKPAAGKISSLAAVAACALAWGGPAPAWADTVTLKNGREIHGRLVEERDDSIRIKTVGGTITIAKSEVATFTENDNFGEEEYGRVTPASERPAPPARGEAGTPAAEQPGRGGESATTPASEGEWRWDPSVSDEQKARLTPVRDALLEELKELPPSEEEMKAVVAVSGPDKQTLDERVQAMGWRQRQGSANLRRENAMKRVIEEFGERSIPRLVQAVGGNNQWVARMSARALGELAKPAGEGLGKDAASRKWLLYRYDAPGALIKLLDHQGEIDSPFIRQEANAALEAITGQKHGWPASTESLRTAAESRAYQAWVTWWKGAEAAWKAEQEKATARRKEIAAALEEVRAGREPGSPDDGQG